MLPDTSSPVTTATLSERPSSAKMARAFAAPAHGLAAPMLVMILVPCLTQPGKVARKRRSRSGS